MIKVYDSECILKVSKTIFFVDLVMCGKGKGRENMLKGKKKASQLWLKYLGRIFISWEGKL